MDCVIISISRESACWPTRYTSTLIITLFFFLSTPGHADDYRFRTLGVESGLPSFNVMQTYQQRSGFIWLASEAGASRYDGKKFQHYQYSPGSNHHISNNFINNIIEDSEQNVWLASEDGLNKIQPDGTVVFYFHTSGKTDSLSSSWTTSLFIDKKNQLWIGTGKGLSLYNDEYNNFTNIPVSKDGELVSLVIYTLFEDQQQRLYATTELGLARLNEKTMHLELVVPSSHNNDVSLLSDYANAALVDKQGLIWLGTENNGLVLYDPIKNVVKNFLHEPDNEHSISENDVFTIAEGKEGVLWLGYASTGLSLFSPISKKFKHIKSSQFDSHSIPSDNISNIFFDQSGLMWVATDSGIAIHSPLTRASQLYRKQPDESGLVGNTVNHIYIDGKNTAWLATTKGLNKLRLDTDEVTLIDLTEISEQPNGGISINNISAASADSIWLVSPNGLTRFNEETNNFLHFDNNPGNEHHFPNNEFYTAQRDTDVGVWLTGYVDVGLIWFDPLTGIKKHFLNTEEDEYLEGGNFSFQTMQDKSKNIWLASTDGVYRIDPLTDNITQFKVGNARSNIRVSGITQASSGEIWASSQGAGLIKLSPDEEDHNKVSLRAFTTIDGLPRDHLMSLIADNQDRLWLTTNNELLSFDILTETFSR